MDSISRQCYEYLCLELNLLKNYIKLVQNFVINLVSL